MTMPLGYISPEQLMKDKAEYARKGIARGRSAAVLQYDDGILFVAETRSRTLHKISEIYDRIAFAAVGMYNEFENLRQAGIKLADVRGYINARRDVTARGLANAYAQTLGSIFTDAHKPYEVEIVVAEVGATEYEDQIYRLTFDGSVQDERGYLVMGGMADQVASALSEHYQSGQSLAAVLRAAVTALGSQGNGGSRELGADELEVGVLDRTRQGRTFRRIQGAALERLLAETAQPAEPEPEATDTDTDTQDGTDETPAGEDDQGGVDGGNGTGPTTS
ncbi:MAG: proteasome subunit alpha [Streptosporangiales bacterium]|nr:proteasome subunit alpha [Streptosporangiales bacterium]